MELVDAARQAAENDARRRARRARAARAFATEGIDLAEAAKRVLQFPAVADKTFLISIGDRTVGGLCARDPMVGPWQVPVADVAVTLADFRRLHRRSDGDGRAFAAGADRRARIGPHGGRRGADQPGGRRGRRAGRREALRQLDGRGRAPGRGRRAVRHGARRRAGVVPGAGHQHSGGQGFAVDAHDVARRRRRQGGDGAGLADRHGICPDRRRARRCSRRSCTSIAATRCCCLSISATARTAWGLGAGASLRTTRQRRARPRRCAGICRRFSPPCRRCTRSASCSRITIAPTADCSSTLAEMAFASRCGLAIELDELPGDALAALFNEELGAVLQVAATDRHDGRGDVRSRGRALRRDRQAGQRVIACASCATGWRCSTPVAWICIEPGPRRRTRCSACATIPTPRTRNTTRILDTGDPGLSPHARASIPPRTSRRRSSPPAQRPKVAILREQGVNGQVEMAAAFDRAGFAAYDVHMTDIIAGRTALSTFAGIVAGGGFSYGDVLGAGEGWAKSILFNARARDEFSAFFARSGTFALGVCNGCQMMSNLHEIIPGHRALAAFRAQPKRTVRGAAGAARGATFAVAVLRRHGRQSHPGRAGAWRRPRRVSRCGAVGRGRAAGSAALRRPSRRYHRAVSVQSERIAASASPD